MSRYEDEEAFERRAVERETRLDASVDRADFVGGRQRGLRAFAFALADSVAVGVVAGISASSCALSAIVFFSVYDYSTRDLLPLALVPFGALGHCSLQLVCAPCTPHTNLTRASS